MKKSFVSVLIAGVVIFMTLGSGAIFAQTGYAVHYSDWFQGKRTANNEVFDQNTHTAAHKKLPFGTKVKITNLSNDRSVVVRINDRMPTRNSNIIDVSKSAAEQLNFVREGRVRVNLEVIDD